MSNLDSLNQYPIERESFRKLIYSIFDDGKILDKIIDEDIETDNFKVWHFDNEIYIVHKDSGTMVNWYKPSHIGRCLTCNKNLTEIEWYEFFSLLNEEVDNL